jgi:hypothetical protein
MSAEHTVNRFAVLPRWPSALGDAARPKGRIEAVFTFPAVRCPQKYPAPRSFVSPCITLDSQRSFKRKPPAAIKSP